MKATSTFRTSYRALLAALVLSATASSVVAAQDWRTLARSRAWSGEESLSVSVEYGAGRLEVKPAADDVLYRANLRYDAKAFEPELQYSGGELVVGFSEGEMKGRHVKGGQLVLQLGPRADTDLDLQFGAAEAEIELGGVRLRNVHIATGASATKLRVSRPNLIEAESVEIEAGAAKLEAHGLGNLRASRFELSGGVGEVLLDFSGAWRADATANIEMGLGSLTIRVPRGLGVRVTRDGFLSGFDGEGLIKRGNVYYSEGYDSAQHHLEIDLDAALGAVRIVWVDG